MTTRLHPKTQLLAADLLPKKQFGQNFLADPAVCARIAEQAAPTGVRTVVEIGAGLGALTATLLDHTEKVIAIERDRDLVPQLQTVFAAEIGQGRLLVVEDDAKTVDYCAMFSTQLRPATLAGNLPYQLTGPLLRRSLEIAHLVERCAFLVQLEVAARLTAKPASDAYGALSVFLQARYEVHRQFVVRRGVFYPQPHVDSALVVLIPLAQPIAEETTVFRMLVKQAFGQRRKKLRNAWASIGMLSAVDLGRAAAAAEIDLDLRGEVLSVEQFAAMAAAVERFGNPEGDR
jgi:16S rRNA (adenine1518-N6/adenine1519-N6)-dimethyltransferase